MVQRHKKLPSRKMINFDLDTNAMKRLGKYPQGYEQLGKALAKQGFEHRQGSGYVTKEEITDTQLKKSVLRAVLQCPWVEDCINKLDSSDYHEASDIADSILRGMKNARKKREKAAKAAQNELTDEDKLVIDRIQKSAKGGEYDAFMAQETLAPSETQRLLHIVCFFSEMSNGGQSAEQAAEQVTRIASQAKSYDGNRAGLYAQSSATVRDSRHASFPCARKGAAKGKSQVRCR